MITELEQRNDRAVSYTLDGNTFTLTLDGETTAYDLPPSDGQWPDPPFPIQRAERRNGALNIQIIRTLNVRGESNESEPSTPVTGAVDWQPWPDPAPERRTRLKHYLSDLARQKTAAAIGLSADHPAPERKFSLMLTEAVLLVNERSAGRGGSARLDTDLKPLAQAVLAIADAETQISIKIDSDTYTEETHIDGAAEWPS